MGIEPIYTIAEHRIISRVSNFVFAFVFAFFEATSENVEITTLFGCEFWGDGCVSNIFRKGMLKFSHFRFSDMGLFSALFCGIFYDIFEVIINDIVENFPRFTESMSINALHCMRSFPAAALLCVLCRNGQKSHNRRIYVA